MKKILIATLIVLTCITAFISCNADTSIGTAIYESVKTVDVQQQSIINIIKNNDGSFTAYLTTENGIDKYTIDANYKVTDTKTIINNKAKAQVADAYWNETDSCIYYLTSGYDDDLSKSTTSYMKLDPSKTIKIVDNPTTTDNPSPVSTDVKEPAVLLSSNLNLYNKTMLDSPFKKEPDSGLNTYNTCRFYLESKGALLLSNEKHWYISTDGSYDSESGFTYIVPITDYIDKSKLSEQPLAFKKIKTSKASIYNYWIICSTYAYVITMDESNAQSEVISKALSKNPISSSTRYVTFENNDTVFFKYSGDYSYVYAYNDKTGRTDFSTYTRTYNLSKTLNIVDVEELDNNDWFAATLDSGLYHVEFNGSTFTATSMQTL